MRVYCRHDEKRATRQITDEEDAREPVALTVLATAVVGTLKGSLPGWVGITATVTGGAYLASIAEKSNRECTESIYGMR